MITIPGAASAKLFTGKRQVDLTGDEDTDSPLASPNGAKKLKVEEEVKTLSSVYSILGSVQ